MSLTDLYLDHSTNKTNKKTKITFFRWRDKERIQEIQIDLDDFLQLHPIRLH